MSKKKKAAIAAAVIVLVIAVAGGIFAFISYRQAEQYNAVMEEVALINEIIDQEYTSDIDWEELDTLLERRVTSGKYEQVEGAYKSYMTDFYEIVYDATDASGDESFTTFLSGDNLESDGPDFEQSYEKIDELIARLQTDKEEYTAMLTEDSVSAYAESAGLEGKYLEMYNTILSAYSYDETQEDVFTESINSTMETLNALIDIFDFLTQNSDDWYIEDGTLIFSSDTLYNSYNELMETI